MHCKEGSVDSKMLHPLRRQHAEKAFTKYAIELPAGSAGALEG